MAAVLLHPLGAFNAFGNVLRDQRIAEWRRRHMFWLFRLHCRFGFAGVLVVAKGNARRRQHGANLSVAGRNLGEHRIDLSGTWAGVRWLVSVGEECE